MAKEKVEKVVEGDFKEVTKEDDTPIEATAEEVVIEDIEDESKVKAVWEKSKPVLKKIRNGLLCAAAGVIGTIGVGYLIGRKVEEVEEVDKQDLYLEMDPYEEEKE